MSPRRWRASGSVRRPAVRVLIVPLLVLLLGGVAAACGGPDDEMTPPTVTTTLPPQTPTDLPSLPVGRADVRHTDSVVVRGSVLRVGSHRVDLAPLHVDAYAVVDGGVYFRNGSELWFTDLSRAQATGFTRIRSLVGSPDGTRIGFAELGHGPPDAHGTPLAIAIAYDATTGRPLVSSYAGMGDLTRDDLAAAYAEHPPTVAGFADGDMLVEGPTGAFRIPLDGSAATPWDPPTGR